MIPINELRYGSWVEYDGKQCLVCEIDGGSESICLYHDSFRRAEDVPIIRIFPIPLTPEVLEKCGFVRGTTVEEGEVMQDGDSEFWDLTLPHSPKEFARNRMCLVRWFGDDGFTYSSQHARVAVDSIHTLQNLYFALSGKELDYTPQKVPEYILQWYKDHDSSIKAIEPPLPYTKGQIIQDLTLFIETQIAGLESPEIGRYYKNALGRLEILREYLITHHNLAP